MPVLDSGRRKIKRTLCTVFPMPLCLALGGKITLAVIGCNVADNGKINDRQLCSHMCAQE